MSVPSDASPIPVATAMALPPLDPPGIRVGSCGLRACGLVTPSANSCVRGLAEDHGAGGAPEVDAVGVGLGDAVVGVRAAAGRHAADVDDVLDGDRDAVQRPAPAAGAQLGVAGARLGQRGLGDRPRRTRSTRPRRSARSACSVSSTDVVAPASSAARGGGDRAGASGSAAERGQRRGRRPEDVVGAGRRSGGSTTCARSAAPARTRTRVGGDDSRPFLLEHAREQLAHASLHDFRAALDVHAHQRGGGVACVPARTRLQDLQVLLDRRLDPVRRS